MGGQMTKELGVYNEEEKVCTPLGPQRYRLLHSDPRSATLGIKRTPIQVECTPKRIKTVLVTENTSQEKTDESFAKDLETKDLDVSNISKDLDVSNISKEEATEVASEVKEEAIDTPVSVETPAQAPYLETDIDKVSHQKATIMLQDVRSPTLELSRTPVLVECTPELFALHSRIDSLSFCDFDVHTDDPSAIVSDDDQTSQHNQSTINNWLTNLDSKPCPNTPANDSFADSPKTVAKKQKEITAMKKKLFFTPDVKDNVKPKVRTPLGDLQPGHVRDSPQKLVKAKQWRNIQEERQRRGLPDAENTPPSLPPLSHIASAPGKMLGKHTKINWDEENTILI